MQILQTIGRQMFKCLFFRDINGQMQFSQSSKNTQIGKVLYLLMLQSWIILDIIEFPEIHYFV